MERSLSSVNLQEKFCPTINNVLELFEGQVQRTAKRMALSL